MRRVQIRKPKGPTTVRQDFTRTVTGRNRHGPTEAWEVAMTGAADSDGPMGRRETTMRRLLPAEQPILPTEHLRPGHPRQGHRIRCVARRHVRPETVPLCQSPLTAPVVRSCLGRRAGRTRLATTLSQAAAVLAWQAKPTRSPNTAFGLGGS
jgi:hypothetical protein